MATTVAIEISRAFSERIRELPPRRAERAC
jgi:hypothetical protein